MLASTNFTPCSSVSIVNVEQVNAGWARSSISIFKQYWIQNYHHFSFDLACHSPKCFYNSVSKFLFFFPYHSVDPAVNWFSTMSHSANFLRIFQELKRKMFICFAFSWLNFVFSQFKNTKIEIINYKYNKIKYMIELWRILIFS